MRSSSAKLIRYSLAGLSALALGCGSTGADYDTHAGEAMRRLASTEPIYVAPANTPEAPLAEWVQELVMESENAQSETRGHTEIGGGAHSPDFMQPPAIQDSAGVETELALQPGQQLAAGGAAVVRYTVLPKVDAADIRVRYTTEGPSSASPQQANAGAGVAGRALMATVQLNLQEGRTELRASTIGHDANGAEVFQDTTSLYFIVRADQVLAGPQGFSALEIQELERRRDAGEITPEEFRLRMNILHPR